MEIHEMPGTLRAGQGARIIRERRAAEAAAKVQAVKPEDQALVEVRAKPPKRAKKAKE